MAQLKSKEKETQEKLSKTNNVIYIYIYIYFLFCFVFVFIFSLSWKFWPQLAREYASFAFLVSVFDLTLKKGKMKSSSYGFRSDIALYVKCLAPGQNSITCIICKKGKSLKEMERIWPGHNGEYGLDTREAV